VAAVALPDARESAPSERFRWLRELGSRAVPTWAAFDSGPGANSARLVAVQRAARGRFDDAVLADWVRDARRVASLDHPNVARVREAVIRKDDVLVVGDYLDGIRWSELAARGTPLAVALRVFVDALSGVAALHNLRDASRQPLKLFHGALSPDAIVVGTDGIARVVDVARPRMTGGPHGGEGNAYRAPEVLLGDASADAKADVYSAGVMLWEALSGARLFDGAQPSTIVTTLLSGRVPGAAAPRDAPWAAPLGAVVSRAMSAEPEKRFASAAEMAAEIRRIVGSRLAGPTRVASCVTEHFGAAVTARRRELEGGPVSLREVSGIAPPSRRSEDAIEIAEMLVAPEPDDLPTIRPPPTKPRRRLVAWAVVGAAVALTSVAWIGVRAASAPRTPDVVRVARAAPESAPAPAPAPESAPAPAPESALAPAPASPLAPAAAAAAKSAPPSGPVPTRGPGPKPRTPAKHAYEPQGI
jgi:eukaryotic-like serine/threonine-protein kinase